MNVVGFSGALDGCGLPPVAPGLSHLFFHDAAAALVQDGELVFAVEEERLNRQKHSNAFPHKSLRTCLEYGRIGPEEVDVFAFFFEEHFFNQSLRDACAALEIPNPETDVRNMLCERLSHHLNFECDPERISFVNHHLAHARSAFAASGYNESMILVLDGNGEKDSASLYQATRDRVHKIISHPTEHSLGHFYRKATRLIGFKDFDEYKLMGLAPYGDPTRLVAEMEELICLGPDGNYITDIEGLTDLVEREGLHNPDWQEMRQDAADFAAAVQAALARTVIHILSPYVDASQPQNLCLAGGVAQNCVMNTTLANSGLFESVFAYPGAYDAGAAIGAALQVSCVSEINVKQGNNFDPFLGPGTPAPTEVQASLEAWSSFLEWHRSDCTASVVARALAAGKIIGWMNGRSEFGPRALGARSILADARPFENWSRINLAIKQRESFRPFAPACLEEFASEYFDMPPAAKNLGHMTFVSKVKEDHKPLLGAVTHVDGSARLQTVGSDWNSCFANVIREFHTLTGCPVVLNTSFNNSAEPIVQTPADAIRTFLLTQLDVLVIDNWVVTKKADPTDHLNEMDVRLTDWSEVIVPNGESEDWTVRRAPFYSVSVPGTSKDFIDELAGRNWVSVANYLSLASFDREDLTQVILAMWRKSLVDVHHVG